jgi:hypothetical protein
MDLKWRSSQRLGFLCGIGVVLLSVTLVATYGRADLVDRIKQRRQHALDGHPVRAVSLDRRQLGRPGIGRRLDGWPNRDLNVGAIVALAPDLSVVADLLQTDQPTCARC